MDGLNIATQVGDGEANVYHWEGVQRTVAQMQQQDIAEQRQLQNDYRRSQIQMQTAGAKLRPADIPQAQAYYGQFRDASLALMDNKVRQNPNKLAAYTQLRDEAMTSYLSHVGRSADAAKFDAMLDEQRLKDKGLNWIDPEEYTLKKQLYKQTPVNDLQKYSLDNVATYTTPADDTPKDWQNKIFQSKVLPDVRPIYDEKNKDKVKAWETSNYTVSTRPIVALSTELLGTLKQSKTLQRNNKEEYNTLVNTDPDQISTTIKRAQELAQTESNGDLAPLDMTPEGYFLAKNLLAAKTKVYDGTKETKPDPMYMQDRAFEQQDKLAKQREQGQWARMEAQINAREAAKKLNGGKDSPATLPDVEFLETALMHPDAYKDGKSMLEHGSMGMSTLNAYSTTAGGGIQMQVLPMWSNERVKGNKWYQNAISQTGELLRTAMDNPETKVPFSYDTVQRVLMNGKNSSQVQRAYVAKVFNEINKRNGVSARFTADDLATSTPAIFSDIAPPTMDNAKGTKKYGILKSGTPEFRNLVERQRNKAIGQLKKFSAGMVSPERPDVSDLNLEDIPSF